MISCVDSVVNIVDNTSFISNSKFEQDNINIYSFYWNELDFIFWVDKSFIISMKSFKSGAFKRRFDFKRK